MTLKRNNRYLLTVAAALALSLAPRSHAQAAAAPPTPVPVYDVMTIKLNNTLGSGTDIDTDDSHFTAKNVSFKGLLAQAYDIKQDLISGLAGPIDSARFDVEAKVVSPDSDALKHMTREQRHAMLLPLLIERFQLKAHAEVKTLPVYELTVAKGGPKLKLSADQNKRDGDMDSNGSRALVTISAHSVNMPSFAKALSSRVDRPVIDKTGVTGNYDFKLQFSRDTPDPDSGVADAPPIIFTAIQEQLGLKLDPGKGPVDTLVIDHATMPSEN